MYMIPLLFLCFEPVDTPKSILGGGNTSTRDQLLMNNINRDLLSVGDITISAELPKSDFIDNVNKVIKQLEEGECEGICKMKVSRIKNYLSLMM
jgi:hypothetical protein